MKKLSLIIMMQSLIMGASLNAQTPDFQRMVEYAIKAPSGHNTQPWKFRLTENTVEIHPDLSRTLSVVDGTNRELYISLGAATENLCIAAREFGYKDEVAIVPDADGKAYIRVSLIKGEDKVIQPLFNQILKRQTNRQIYTGKSISKDTLNLLTSVVPEEGVHLHFYSRKSPEYSLLKEFVLRGNEYQMNDKGFKDELTGWIRLNKKDVEKHHDGLTYKAMGSPSVPSFIGKPIVRSFLKAKTQNKSDRKNIDSSSHLVLLTGIDNTPKGWVALGRTLERFLLETTRLGVANAYLNQPCEVPALAEELRQKLSMSSEHPTLLLRIGYASPMPYSPRKTVEAVIIH